MQKVTTSTTTNVRTQCKTKVVLEVIRQNTRPSMRFFFLCPTSFKMYIQEFWGANLHQCFNDLLKWKINSSNQVSNQQEERFHGFGNISTFPHCKLSFSSVQLIGTVVSLMTFIHPVLPFMSFRVLHSCSSLFMKRTLSHQSHKMTVLFK